MRPAGDHPSRKGWIWFHHLLGFPCEGAGCRSRQVLHEDDGEFPHQRSLLCSKKIHTQFLACVTHLLNVFMSSKDGTLFFFYIMRNASLHLDCRNCQTSHIRLSVPPPPGGPADQAGLQQLDTLLQLNGQPVEQWKCVDLAHAIRYQDKFLSLARAALEKCPFDPEQ